MSETTNIEWATVVASNGYVLVRVGKDHHQADCRGYAYQHRLVAERKIGRRLNMGELVHHLNGNKQDNSESNLEVVASIGLHRTKHRTTNSKLRLPGEANPIVGCACGCKTLFRKYDSTGRPRSYVSGHNPSLSDKRNAVIALAQDRREVHIEMIAPLVSSKGAAKVMLSKLTKEGLLKRKARGIYVPTN